MAIKHWLLDQISLQTFFEKNKINYVFIRGFPNHCPDIEKIAQQGSFTSIPEIVIPEDIKNILDFDNLPDHYLYNKLKKLISLYQIIDKSKCLGYNTNNTEYGLSQNFKDDRADDGRHPGKISNQLISQQILDYCNNKGIEF
jgi:hypothetical protein